MKVLCTVVLLSSMLFGQILYEEHFTGGVAQLQWDPWVDPSVMTAVSDPTTPGGDSWIGCVSNSGAPIACMYAGDYNLTDYQVEAWIFTTVAAAMGAYNGLCVRIDTATAVNSLYQLVSDFDSDGRLRLRHIAGATATVIRDWTSAEIPGGVPASSSWHKFKLKVVADSIWAYYDDTMLPDCPFIDDRVTKGYFGIYFFNVMVADSTRCDDIIASIPTGISEYGSQTVNTVAVYPNPFRNNVQLRYSILDTGYSMEKQIFIYDAAGRVVRSLDPVSSIQNQESVVVWDGRDAAGNAVAPGVYFITDGTGVQREKVVKLR
jgi:hypothetical protein